MKHWMFLSNHAHVLLCVAEDPDIRLTHLAKRVGITERATQRILADLVEQGCVLRTRSGRRNHYDVLPGAPVVLYPGATTNLAELLSGIQPLIGGESPVSP